MVDVSSPCLIFEVFSAVRFAELGSERLFHIFSSNIHDSVLISEQSNRESTHEVGHLRCYRFDAALLVFSIRPAEFELFQFA